MSILVLYDGPCGICNKFVSYLLARDRADIFLFAPLQGQVAQRALIRHGIQANEAKAVHVLLDYQGPSERVLDGGRAILFTLSTLGGAWRLVDAFKIVPHRIINWCYKLVAERRIRRYGDGSCRIYRKGELRKFLRDEQPNLPTAESAMESGISPTP